MPKSILVIEDDAGLLEDIELLLTFEGYRPLLARSGEEGLHIAATEAVDAIICDLLPDISGLDVITALKAKAATASIPVIVISGGIASDTYDVCIKAGAADFLTKPFDIQTLVDCLQSILTIQRDDVDSTG